MIMNQSPKYAVDTDKFFLVDTILGTTDITNIVFRLYRGSTDVSYNCLTGEASYIRNTYVTPYIQNLKGGNTYMFIARVTIGGEVKTRKCKIIVQKESDLQ